MSNLQRIKEICKALLMILFGLMLLVAPEEGYYLVTVVLSISLSLSGIRWLVFYFTMARHMIGGKEVFYKGLILLDVGLFTFLIVDIPMLYVICYLLVCHAFAGLVDILKAFEARRIESPAWKASMTYGICNLAIAVATFVAGILRHSTRAVVWIYSAGLIYSAFVRIRTAFRKNAIVYIQ